MRVPLRFFIGRPSFRLPKKESDRELPDAVARRSWVLRGVTYVGVAEEARTRGFVPPALAGFAFLAAGRACCDVKYRGGPGASSSSRTDSVAAPYFAGIKSNLPNVS